VTDGWKDRNEDELAKRREQRQKGTVRGGTVERVSILSTTVTRVDHTASEQGNRSAGIVPVVTKGEDGVSIVHDA
jgi:hypothetical protein